MHLHRSLFFNLQPATSLKETSAYIFFREFAKFYRNNFIMEKLLQNVLKVEFYEKWRTSILIIKRFRKVDRAFIENRL